MKPPVPAGPKKPYLAPKLLVYGSLTEMTQSTNNNPNAKGDGGTLFHRKKTA